LRKGAAEKRNFTPAHSAGERRGSKGRQERGGFCESPTHLLWKGAIMAYKKSRSVRICDKKSRDKNYLSVKGNGTKQGIYFR